MQRAAVLIVTLVGVGRDELVDQVTIRRVDFHPVKPGVQRIACGLCVMGDQLVNLQHA